MFTTWFSLTTKPPKRFWNWKAECYFKTERARSDSSKMSTSGTIFIGRFSDRWKWPEFELGGVTDRRHFFAAWPSAHRFARRSEVKRAPALLAIRTLNEEILGWRSKACYLQCLYRWQSSKCAVWDGHHKVSIEIPNKENVAILQAVY